MKKTLFITGGSRGIGRGIALVFAQNGYDVAFTYHTAEDAAVSLKKEIEQLGQKAYYRQASLEEKGGRILGGRGIGRDFLYCLQCRIDGPYGHP